MLKHTKCYIFPASLAWQEAHSFTEQLLKRLCM